jgi:hypothetical protein
MPKGVGTRCTTPNIISDPVSEVHVPRQKYEKTTEESLTKETNEKYRQYWYGV